VLGTVLPRVLVPPEPTPEPISPQKVLKDLLLPVSSDRGVALSTTSAPQYDALIWLAGNANLDVYSDERRFKDMPCDTLL